MTNDTMVFHEKLGNRPLSEWQIYKFTPQPDITAFELALIIANITTGSKQMYNEVMVHPEIESEEWEKVKRHFTAK